MGGAFGPYDAHAASEPDAQRLAAAWDAFGERMADHYPFFHPRYAGQMLKPPHPVAVAGYLAAMLVNPNNHALDGGPGTSALEVEVVDQLRVMFGLPAAGLGHLTSSGTIANLEALWVARELHPGKRDRAQLRPRTTPTRACASCSASRARAVAPDADGRHRPRRRRGRVRDAATSARSCSPPGTTGLGAVDRVDEALALRERYGVRLHVDAAYGGFFTLLAARRRSARRRRAVRGDRAVRLRRRRPAQARPPALRLRRGPLRATRRSGGSTSHDSPYTYFTEAELHLGEISLECSRAGAAAAGAVADAAGAAARARRGPRRGARRRAPRRARLGGAAAAPPTCCALHVEPELDIVTYLPRAGSLSALDAASGAVLNAGMEDPDDPVFLSTLHLGRDALARAPPRARGRRRRRARAAQRAHEARARARASAWLHERVEGLARAALA